MPSWIETVLQWLIDLLLWVPRQIYKLVLEGLAAVINAIPVPSFMTDLSANAGAMWASIGWWGDLARVPEGVTLVLAAYALRFLVRRLPLVG